MGRYDTTGLKVFKALLRFYPKEYRNEYGQEMLYLAFAMLQNANARPERARIMVRLVCDFTKSVAKQNIIIYKYRLDARPRYLRHSSLAAIALLTPYIFICAYNLVASTTLHRRTLLMQWEAHSWMVYRIFLPLVALIIVAVAAAVRVYKGLKNKDELLNGSGFAQDALMLGVPLTLLTTVALL